MQENGHKLRWQQNHPTTGLFTQLLGFSPNYWAFHPTTWLFTQLLGFTPNYWALHPTTGLPPEYWASTRILGIYSNTGNSPKYPNPIFCFHYAGVPSQSGHGHMLSRSEQVFLSPPPCNRIWPVITNRIYPNPDPIVIMDGMTAENAGHYDG